jgi:GNAT superfamily N-acetyltransferase
MLTVRPRTSDDIGGCVDALALVHSRDAYPLMWPADPAEWIADRQSLGAWVVDREDGIVGHVMLRMASGPPVTLWTEATGFPPECLAVVSRLFVVPQARRLGIAGRLVGVAVQAARAAGLQPVLDALLIGDAAIAVYEHLGWQRAGVFEWQMPDGTFQAAAAYVY